MSPPTPSLPGKTLSEALFIRLRAPVELALTAAVRRLARRRPEVFERLGEARLAVFVLAPDELPVAFRLEPRGTDGRVQVVRRDGAAPYRTWVAGPLGALLALFDGALDADSAFFSRAIRVEGDTAALMALHNALEAAELSLTDLLPLPAAVQDLAGPALSRVRRRAFGLAA